MNRSAMPRTLAAALLALVLTACNAESPPPEPPLAGAAIGGPFELVNSDGETVRWSDFDGKYRMVYFGYAYCPDVCPLDVQRMVRGYERFKQDEPALAAQVQPIFITIDPQRDTPEVVGEFTANFSDDLIGLTGTPAQVDRAAKAFAVYYARGQGTADNYLMDHSRGAFLMGRRGEPIAPLPIDVKDGGEAVAAELNKWVS
jgi:protein SCO1/2